MKANRRSRRLARQLFQLCLVGGKLDSGRVRQVAIPRHAPDWYFESELHRSGLWTMMERCYPTARAQSQ